MPVGERITSLEGSVETDPGTKLVGTQIHPYYLYYSPVEVVQRPGHIKRNHLPPEWHHSRLTFTERPTENLKHCLALPFVLAGPTGDPWGMPMRAGVLL